MLKLATVFSGIGAIEHALERLGIEYSIEFACDNGDVDILSKDISDTITDIDAEIKELFSLVDKNSKDDIWLIQKLERVSDSFNSAKKNLSAVEKETFEPIEFLVQKLLHDKIFNANQKKYYEKVLSELETTNGIERIYLLLKTSIKLNNDINRMDVAEIEFPKLELTVTYLKELSKEIKVVREELSMLHERINTENIRKKVFSLDTAEEQKAYVDSLYEGRESQNNVKKSYFANYDIDNSRFHWNVSFLDGTKFSDDIDLFVGGSPCQSFSLVGKQRGLGDTRGTLFYEYARLVSEINLKYSYTKMLELF